MKKRKREERHLSRSWIERERGRDGGSKEMERDRTVRERLVKGWMALRRFSRSRQDLSTDGSVNSVTPVNKYG